MNIQSVIIKLMARILFGRFIHLELQKQRAMMNISAPKPRDVNFQPVQAGGVAAEWVVPQLADPEKVLLHLHGGAYVMGSIASHRSLAARLGKAAGMRTLLIDYRLAPENPFPAALDDTLSAYRWLLKSGVETHRLVISGDSAGGGLALAALVALRDAGEPTPAAAVLLSPWIDLACTGESFHSKARLDPILHPDPVKSNAILYAGEHNLDHPLVSPLYADLQGLPPLLIQVGSDEILLDDSTRLAERVNEAGGQVSLDIFDGMVHVFQLFADLLPISRRAIEEIGAFIRKQVGY